MVNTATQVILRRAHVAEWEKEKAQLEAEIRERQIKLDRVVRKLQAVAVLAEDDDAAETGDEEPFANRGRIVRDAEEGDDEDGSQSIPASFLENMRATGASLNVRQARQRLIDIGFSEKVKNQPNYVYSLLHRLTKAGKLVRRGSKYKSAAANSGETAH